MEELHMLRMVEDDVIVRMLTDPVFWVILVVFAAVGAIVNADWVKKGFDP